VILEDFDNFGDKIVRDIRDKAIVEANVKVLVDSLRSSDPWVRAGATFALSLLVKFVPYKEAIAAADGIQALLRLLGGDPVEDPLDSTMSVLVELLHSEDEVVQGAVVRTLWKLVRWEEDSVISAIVDANGIPAWVKLLDSQDARVQEYSAKMLDKIARGNAERQHAILDAHGIPALLKKLNSTEERVQTAAAWALSSVSCYNPRVQHAIASCDGCIHLAVLSNCAQSGLKLAATIAYSNVLNGLHGNVTCLNT
jgi:HEAT repeat protein